MKILNREKIIIILIKRYIKRLDLYSFIGKEKLEKSTKMIVIALVNDLCDLNKKQVVPLSEEETFVLRKNLGIFDNGFTQPRKLIGKELNKNTNQMETMFRIIDEKIIKKILMSIEDVKNLSEEQILELDVECLGLSVNTYNLIKRAGIKKISELKNMTTRDVRRIKRFRLKDAEEVIMMIHSLGLYFKDEETINENISVDVEKEVIDQDDEICVVLLNKEIERLLKERELLTARLEEINCELEFHSSKIKSLRKNS